MRKTSVIVLGAGVSGLSCGILLLRAGYDVTLWAKELPPYTTSNKAAAVWYPFIVRPYDKATTWARSSLQFFHDEQLLNLPQTGTKKIKVIEIFTHPKEDPWWRAGVDSFRRTRPDELPTGYEDGYAVEGLIMETDTYMDYLLQWYQKEGGMIQQKEIQTVQEAFSISGLVVNCTGLGSRSLFGDESVYPSRGQILRVKPNGFDYSVFEEEGPNSLSYIIPRLNDIILGGTAQENNWNLEPDPKDTEDILRKCGALYPQFFQAEILEIKVGLRPARSTLRLEIEKYDDHRHVVHNYGHGGSGLTIGWGCAMDVVKLVQSISL